MASSQERIARLLARYVELAERGGVCPEVADLCSEEPGLAPLLEQLVANYEKWEGGFGDRDAQAIVALLLADAETGLPSRLRGFGTERGPAEPAWLAPGRILGERYRILSLLGRGGQGEVWLAMDVKLRVEVALKALRRELLGSRQGVELLRGEVRAAREVVSPNVCRIFDLVEAGGEELVSMEYVDGSTLREVLAERGPLGVEEAREIASQLLAGLSAIHDAGLVHRDLKPENVMLTRAGRVVVMDLGLARVASETGTGSVAGTPAYMAPEQADGVTIDARADVFAAGLILAEMVALAAPGDREARRRLHASLVERPLSLAGSSWASPVERALSQTPGDRPPSAAALSREIDMASLAATGEDVVSPYPGLDSFCEADAPFFFGREADVETLWKKLRRCHLMALIGPSGAGKTSFLHAGLRPTQPAGWRLLVCQPDVDPFRSLAAALAGELAFDPEAMRELSRLEDPDASRLVFRRWRASAEEALLVVDPFEELFTLASRDVQARFAALLGSLPVEADVRVLLSLRDDFLIRCHEQPSLAPIFSELMPLGVPRREELRRALVQPAIASGYRFEDDELVDEMVAGVSQARGALPLLAFAASRLWERRDRSRRMLTRRAYEAIGGVGGALAQHAEVTLEALGPGRRDEVREIFRLLVTAEGTRASREIGELATSHERPERAREVVDALVDARLLTSYEVPASGGAAVSQRVEIVHESLLAAWPRLLRWRSQDADGALFRDQLRMAARVWQERGRPEELLWTGSSRRELSLWRERFEGALSELELAFADRVKEVASRRRRRRRIAVAAAFVVLLLVAGTILALWRRSEAAFSRSVEANRELRLEERRVRASQLLALGRLALPGDPSAALAYAIASLELADGKAARRFAVEASWRGPFRRVVDERESWRCRFSPTGNWLLHWDIRELPRFRAYSSRGGEAVELPSLTGQQFVGFRPGLDLVVTWDSRDETLRTWSLPEGHLVSERRLPSRGLLRLPRGANRVFGTRTVGEETEVRSFSFEGEESHSLGRLPGAALRTWRIGADGREVVAVDAENRLRFLANGRPAEVVHFAQRADAFRTALDPRARFFAWTDTQGRVTLLPLRDTGEGARELPGEGGAVARLAFDDRASRLAAVWFRGAVALWDLEAPGRSLPLVLRTGETKQMNFVDFHPDGRWLASAGDTSGLDLWRFERRMPRVLEHEAPVWALAFSPDGRWIATGSDDGAIRLWSLESQEIRILRPADPSIVDQVTGLAFSPDGKQLATSLDSGRVLLLDLEGVAVPLAGFRGLQAWPIAFGPRGDRVATAGGQFSREGAVVVEWDLRTGTSRELDPGDGRWIFQLRYRHDGSLLAASEGGLRLWEEGGRSAKVLDPRSCRFDLSPDENTLYTWCFEEGLDSPDGAREGLRIDLVGGGAARRLPAGHGLVRKAAVAKDGLALATTGDDGILRVGRLDGSGPHLLFGHSGRIQCLAFSPDGRWIATGSQDSTVRLWPIPDLRGRPDHLLPRNELLRRLRERTNLRVVESPDDPSGYGVVARPFRGWASAGRAD